MRPGSGAGRHDRLVAVRAWPIWELAPWLRTYIVAVLLANLLAIGFAARAGLGSGRDLVLLAILVACDAATVEVYRRAGENAGVIKDVYGVWELPVAILLPPVYALLVPILRQVLAQWRIRRSRCTGGCSRTAVLGLVVRSGFLGLPRDHRQPAGVCGRVRGPHLAWILAVALAGSGEVVDQHGHAAAAVKSSDPAARVRDLALGGEAVQNDVAELCVAVLVTFAVAVNLPAIVFALPLCRAAPALLPPCPAGERVPH